MASLSPLLWGLALGGGAASGLLAGLFGVGGGTLMVPLLLGLGLPLAEAVALSLVYIFFTSLSGTRTHWQQGSLVPRVAAWMGLSALFSAGAGVWITGWIPAALHLWLFIGFLLLMAALFIWPLPRQKSSTEGEQTTAVWVFLGIGLLAGLLASLFGVGGGFVMVPLLVSLSELNIHQATGTSLGAIALISLGTLLQQSLFGSLQQLSATHFLLLLGMSSAGMLAAPWGARLSQRLPQIWLKRGFLSLIGLIVLYLLSRQLQV